MGEVHRNLQQAADTDWKEWIAEFVKVMNSANQNLLKSCEKSAAGFDNIHCPIHKGEHYEWFTANESGRKLSLPDLTSSDPLLPSNPSLSKNSST